MKRERDPADPTRRQLLAMFASHDVYLPYPDHDPYVAQAAAREDGGIAELLAESGGRRYIKLPAGGFEVRPGDGSLSLTVDSLGLRLNERIAPALMCELAWRLRESTGIVVETDGWMLRRPGAGR